MTASVKHATYTARSRTGWSRWSAHCVCGWSQQADSREHAQQLAAHHGRGV